MTDVERQYYEEDWKLNNGIQSEQIRDKDLTAIQRAYDRSSATYGATAEMLRQSGLNNSGLAGLYQNMAETNRRQGIASVNEIYAENERKNKQDFNAHMQGVNSQLYSGAITDPYATEDDLVAIAKMNGIDNDVLARQMAQSIYLGTAGIRERALQDEYRKAESDAQKYISEIASTGGALDANAIAKMYPTLAPNGDLSAIQNMIDNSMNSYAYVYANNAAAKIYQDLVNGTLKVADLDEKREEIAKKYGVPKSMIDSAFKTATTEYNDYILEKEAIAKDKASSFNVGFDVTDDMVKDFASKLGISEDIAREYLSAEKEKTEDAADEIWRLFKEGKVFFHSDTEVKNFLDDYYDIDYFTKEEARLIYNNYVDKYTADLKKAEEAAKAKAEEEARAKAHAEARAKAEAEKAVNPERIIPEEKSAYDVYKDVSESVTGVEDKGLIEGILYGLGETISSIYDTFVESGKTSQNRIKKFLGIK